MKDNLDFPRTSPMMRRFIVRKFLAELEQEHKAAMYKRRALESRFSQARNYSYGCIRHRERGWDFYICPRCIVEKCHCIRFRDRRIEFADGYINRVENFVSEYLRHIRFPGKRQEYREQVAKKIVEKLHPKRVWFGRSYYLKIGDILKLMPHPRPRCPVCHASSSQWKPVLNEALNPRWLSQYHRWKLIFNHKPRDDCLPTHWLWEQRVHKLAAYKERFKPVFEHKERMEWQRIIKMMLTVSQRYTKDPSPKNRDHFQLLQEELKQARTFQIT